MGNNSGKGGQKPSLHLYGERLETSAAGERVHSCSFEKWIGGVAKACGFSDAADYSTPRDDFRCRGFILRPDLTEGRFLKASQACKNSIVIDEKHTKREYNIPIPHPFTSGKIPQKLHMDYRGLVMNYVQQQIAKDGIGVIGCHGNFAVIQFLDRRHCHVPEFYFVDLEKEQCLGKFSTKEAELLWYECYISPDGSCVILRPDTYNFSWCLSEPIKVHTVGDYQVIMMKQCAESHGYAFTFDYRHGHRYLFRAKDKTIQLYDLQTQTVVQSQQDLNIPASIRQLKSSPSGEFVAARCIYPVFSMEYNINSVVMISADSLQVLFVIDARGPFWPVSEIVNLQVFPRFSVCDSAVAVMKHGTSKRKIHVYKLPVTLSSLQHCCRKVIRRTTSQECIEHLPLPSRVLKFLQYEL